MTTETKIIRYFLDAFDEITLRNDKDNRRNSLQFTIEINKKYVSGEWLETLIDKLEHTSFSVRTSKNKTKFSFYNK